MGDVVVKSGTSASTTDSDSSTGKCKAGADYQRSKYHTKFCPTYDEKKCRETTPGCEWEGTEEVACPSDRQRFDGTAGCCPEGEVASADGCIVPAAAPPPPDQ